MDDMSRDEIESTIPQGSPSAEARIAALEAALAELRAGTGSPSRGEQRSSRRTILRVAGAAAMATAAAAFGSADEAAAAGSINSDVTTNASTLPTALVVSGFKAAYGFGVIDHTLGAVPPEIGAVALLGHAAGRGPTNTGSNNFNNGVGGYSAAGGRGVAGQSDGGDGSGIGVFGAGIGTSAAGVYGSGVGDSAIGVTGIGTGTSSTGVRGQGDAVGVTGTGDPTTTANTFIGGTSFQGGSGVAGSGYHGVFGVGTIGVLGFGNLTDATSVGVAAYGAVGARCVGYVGALQLGTAATAIPPARTHAVTAATLEPDSNHGLWWCIADGTPGTWRQISGPDTAGAFHAITPTRVYDSRVPIPVQGPLIGGTTRTLSVADGRNLDTGAVTTKDLIPTGTTAITCNLTVVDTTGAGFLTVNPGGTTTVSAASINWYTGGQTLNNGTVAAISTDRTVTVIAGGGGNAFTHFIIDITGYYR